MPDSRSFEERIFARFDALESQLSDVRARLERLEQKAYDMKPIWERALAEILALGDRMHSLERKFNVLGRDMLTLRGDQERIEDRMDKLESKPVQ